LGKPDQLAAAVATKHPSRIIVSGRKSCAQIPPGLLLKLGYSGIAIDGAPVLYESALCRVCWDPARPFDLMFSMAENANPLEVAIRAAYTNLIGLLLLLVFAPVLIVVAVLVAVSGGGGPVLERAECVGLQRMPFERLRFRTCGSDGEETAIGRVLSRCHLAGLPQIINVVRGEMALFGPPPVRKEFADVLSQMIPVYPYRFTVKPGLLGWSQAHLRRRDVAVDETMRLEYDLYYVKRASVSLDLEILLRSAMRAPRPSMGAS
jgi:lipopolysaccharide/colanic/teichoic acid biosynthesis glycosyltransferase